MDATTMVREVSEEAGVDEALATRAIGATLRVLAERVNGDEARQLAAELPREFQGALVEAAAGSPGADPFDLGQFVHRVGEQVGVGDAQAERIASAVLHAVGAAVEPGRWDDVLAQLPSTMDSLVGRERRPEGS